MAVRPKTRSLNNGQPTEDLACGYVMHQYKGIRCKMRWGQLWTGEGENGLNRCDIRLFKYDIIKHKPGTFTKTDLKLKISFEFHEDEFCGLEKGEHYTKNGKRRYICIILKDRHLIVQDAITALTDTDHNVIGTWYGKITSTMKYVNRWKIFNFGDASADTKYFHVSKVNTCVCYSLHNSHAGQKGKNLLDQFFKTKAIVNVDEIQETLDDGNRGCRILFYELNYGMDVKQSVVVHGIIKLSKILSDLGRSQQTNTLCPRFDDLVNVNPNLVRVSPEERKADPPTRTLKELSDTDRVGRTNNYIVHDPDNGRSPPGAAGLFSSTSVPFIAEQRLVIPARDINDINPRGNRGLPSRPEGIDPSSFSPTNPFATGPRHHDGPNRLHHDPHLDSNKKAQDLSCTTQRSFDSDYLTGEMSSLLQSSATNYGVRSNVLLMQNNSSEVAINQPGNINGHYLNVLEPISSNRDTTSSNVPGPSPTDIIAMQSDTSPPCIPPREGYSNIQTQFSTDDLIQNAIREQSLPPIDTNPDSARPGYENSLNIEITIAEILERNHADVDLTNLGLPYAVYMSLILGLEKESVSNGSWRGLASALCMSFHDVELIESAVHTHPQLLPAYVVLLHWHRTQAPYKFTRRSLRNILCNIMKRLDLAALIPVEESTDNEMNLNNETQE